MMKMVSLLALVFFFYGPSTAFASKAEKGIESKSFEKARRNLWENIDKKDPLLQFASNPDAKGLIELLNQNTKVLKSHKR